MKHSRAAALQTQAAQNVADRVAQIEAKIDTLILGTPAFDQVPSIAHVDAAVSQLAAQIDALARQIAEIQRALEALTSREPAPAAPVAKGK